MEVEKVGEDEKNGEVEKPEVKKQDKGGKSEVVAEKKNEEEAKKKDDESEKREGEEGKSEGEGQRRRSGRTLKKAEAELASQESEEQRWVT